MSNTSSAFSCQTTTGTLGTASQKIRITNISDNPAWNMTIAATGGPTALWSNGTKTFDFNASAGSGCTNGQLTIASSGGTLTPQSICTTTSVAPGTSGSFAQGTTDSITLATGVGGAMVDCYWDLTGIGLSQKVPPTQSGGSYSLGLTITITAN
jgi:hypothetical protein